MDDAVRTPLHERLESMGGTFQNDDGWWWIQGLGDWEAEYRAVRTDVGVWDLSPLVKWEFLGPDALAAANHVNSNDLTTLAIGQVRYGPLLNEAGGVVDDATTYRVSEDRVLVMTNGQKHEDYWAEHLSEFDVTITNIVHDMPHLSIQGPRSREVVQSLTDADLSALGYFRFIPEPVVVGGATGLLARTGYGGELGYEFFTDAAGMVLLFDALVEKGATPFGTAAIYPLRLEAGLVIAGLDYDPGVTTPYDCGLEKFVRLDTGHFVGRDALVAVAADPPSIYRTLMFDGELPERRTPVTRDGVEIGTFRAGSTSPAFGVIGAAVLARGSVEDGEVVDVGGVTATVAPWCVYDPEKRRPRA
jgi:aminomethyltransferase